MPLSVADDNIGDGAEQAKPFKPGTLRSIKLTNFMCHDSFEIEFGSRVNFVMGPNGSGKSAILTAIVFALGANANSTARGKTAKEFLKYGKKFAKVTLTIHNYDKVMEKERAFKPDDYGKFIVIEKVIHQQDPSYKLTLRNDKLKKVSETRAELDEMLDHFGILINNPICILNQEVSKTFLHSQKPQDKFELFMKATNLEQIEQNYKEARKHQTQWKGCNDRSTVAFRMLDNEYNSCREKLAMIENFSKLADIKSELNLEMMYSCVKDKEIESAKLEEKVLETREKIKSFKDDIERRTTKIKKFEEEIESLQIQGEAMNQTIDENQQACNVSRVKETDIRKLLVESDHKVKSSKARIQNYEADKISLEKSIEESKRQLEEANALDRDSERRKLDIERLENELPNDKAREKSIRLHVNQLGSSMTSTRTELHAANTRISEIKNKLSQSNATLRRLKNGQEDQLRRFGDLAVRIRTEIDQAHKAGRFIKKPIGPLGYYLKLMRQDIAAPLELCLGRNSQAFICDNKEDMYTLNSLLKKNSGGMPLRLPIVITRKFTTRHNISRNVPRHPKHKTLLEYLDIQDDAVFNALVDRTNIECMLFIPDYTEAQDILMDASLVPENTRCAYTRDCSQMFPITSPGGYRAYSNNAEKFMLYAESNMAQIKSLEQEISVLQTDERDAEFIARGINDSLKTQRREFDETNAEIAKLVQVIRSKEEQLLNLKTTINVEPQELQGLENERERCINLIETEKIKLGELKEVHAGIDQDLRDILKRRAGLMDTKRKLQLEKEKVIKAIEAMKASKAEAELAITQNKSKIANRTDDLEHLSKTSEKAIEELARAKQQIPTDKPKPQRIRSIDVIREDIKKVETEIRIEREDTRDPAEVQASIENRMRVIDELTSNKDTNLSNYDLGVKSLEDREVGVANLRNTTIGSVSTTFSSVMRSMKMNGVLEVQVDDVVVRGEVVKKGRSLEMRIDTHYAPSQRVMSETAGLNDRHSGAVRRQSNTQPPLTNTAPRPKRARLQEGAYAAPNQGINESRDNLQEKENGLKMTDSRSLSGGERSFSTIAFVLALWKHCASPFKLMDEIDVFMDMVTRRISYNALIRFAQCSDNPGQVIFFTPLELPTFDDANNFVRVFEMPQVIRKQPQSQAETN